MKAAPAKKPKKLKVATNGSKQPHIPKKHLVGASDGIAVKIDAGIPLENCKWEEYCVLVSCGYSAMVAYQKVYGCTYSNAHKNAYAIKANPGIVERIAFLRKLATDDKISTLNMLLNFHREVVGTPVGILDQDHFVTQEAKRKRRVIDRGEDAPPEEWEYEEIKGVSKSDSAKELARLTDNYPDSKSKVDVTHTLVTLSPTETMLKLRDECIANPTLRKVMRDTLLELEAMIEAEERKTINVEATS